MTAFRGKSDTSTTTAASIGLAPNAATLNGDWMLAVVSVRGPDLTQNSITAPAGWTEIDFLFESGSPSLNVGVYQKYASGEGASYSWTFGTSNEAVASLLSYSGVHATTAVHAHAIGGQATGSTTRLTPDITVSESGCWVISYFADRSGSTWVGPDTERSEVKVAATSASQVVCDSAAAVATGTVNRTATASASSSVAVQGILAIRPTAPPASSAPPPGLRPQLRNLLIR